MRDIIWIDLATTGPKSWRHGIVKASFIIEKKGEVVHRQTFAMNPLRKKAWDELYARADGMTRAQVEALPDAGEVMVQMEAMFALFADPYDKDTRPTPAGFNVSSDLDFLAHLWRAYGNEHLFEYIGGGGDVDPFRALGLMEWGGLIAKPERYTLPMVCEMLGVPMDSFTNVEHGVEAARNLSLKLVEIMKQGIKEVSH